MESEKKAPTSSSRSKAGLIIAAVLALLCLVIFFQNLEVVTVQLFFWPVSMAKIVLMLLIGVLSATGLWPRIIRGFRELRGDIPPQDTPETHPGDLDLCYRLLGISPSAPWPEVEKAYRRKAKVHHPDHGGDEDAMRVLNEAYERLKKTRGPRARQG